MPREAELARTDAGLVPASEGWFVVNVREARWIRRDGRGHNVPLTGWTEEEAETLFPQLGVNITVVAPGEPMAMYHWEADAEAFLVLAGEALLLVEGEERPLRRWDFFHCPPRTEHVIVGAGDGPCVVLAVSAREHQTGAWGEYTVADVALRHGAGVTAATTDADVAYARFAPSQPVRYPGGLLPE